VSKSKYEGLKKKLAATEADRDQQLSRLEGELTAEKKRAAEIQKQLDAKIGELEEANERIASLEKIKGELENNLTAVVKDKARLQASAQELKQAVAELSARKAEADKRVAAFRALIARFKSLIDAGKLRVKITDGRMVLALPTDVLFSSGKAKLNEEGKKAILEVAGVLATIPNRKFQIEGHTDNVPIKTSRYPSNWALASARALNVLDTMREAGLAGEVLSAASFGEFRPVASNDDEAGRAANRRIEIVLVPDLSLLPGFSELNAVVNGK
jgi:chemotaxis protein MotB